MSVSYGTFKKKKAHETHAPVHLNWISLSNIVQQAVITIAICTMAKLWIYF